MQIKVFLNKNIESTFAVTRAPTSINPCTLHKSTGTVFFQGDEIWKLFTIFL